jgi:Spy/CpxP family protein refolding chaperone
MKAIWLALTLAGFAPLPLLAQDVSPWRHRERIRADYWDRLDLTEQQRDRLRALREERRDAMRRQSEELRDRMRDVFTDEQRQRLETLRETRRQNRELLRDRAWRREMVRREFDRDLWRRDDLRRRAREQAWERRMWDDYWHDRRTTPRFRRYPI